LKLKAISVGNYSVWAISEENDLYFRENVTKVYPEGTKWLKVDSNVSSVSVNYKNKAIYFILQIYYIVIIK
jgi:hypothetical protein